MQFNQSNQFRAPEEILASESPRPLPSLNYGSNLLKVKFLVK